MEDDTRTWRLRAGGYSSPRVTRPGRLPSRVTGPGCPLFQTRSPVRGTLSACFRGRLCPLAKNITALFSSQDIPCLKRAGGRASSGATSSRGVRGSVLQQLLLRSVAKQQCRAVCRVSFRCARWAVG
ncbi:uncharacterized protein LOC144134655 isoform X1 [Amblyomma americanum]